MFDFKSDKYIIFLQDRFFKKGWFKTYTRVIKALENNGITVVSNKDIIHFQTFTKNALLFDDKLYPELNCLYIHLYNGLYYNDAFYIKKKIEKEREMLLLLAGKLGVREMSYSSVITETSIANIGASITIKGLENKIKYTKNKTVKESTSGHEIYQNRGASVYLTSKTRDAIDQNILNSLSTMKSKIFSYDYYKNSPKLESFVYKRFVFKMLHLEYTIDVEDISEKSFIVKSCLMNYGLGIRIDENLSNTETITFKFDFFTDKELRIQLMETIRKENDDFVAIREVYDDATNKDLAVHYIANYVRNLAAEIKYSYTTPDSKNIRESTTITDTYKTLLNTWISKKGLDIFYGCCHNFTNSIQIKDWIIEICNLDTAIFDCTDADFIPRHNSHRPMSSDSVPTKTAKNSTSDDADTSSHQSRDSMPLCRGIDNGIEDENDDDDNPIFNNTYHSVL